MKAPTDKALIRWWDQIKAQFPGAVWTCHDCGKQDQGAYVQPQHPFYLAPDETGRPRATCSECIGKHNAATRELRKTELAKLPRCEVPDCGARGNWKTAGVLICGRHLAKCKREYSKIQAGAGGMAMFMSIPFDRSDVLRWSTS